MIIHFSKINSIAYFTTALVIYNIFKRYLYGSILAIFSLFVGLYTILSKSEIDFVTNNPLLFKLPAYLSLLVVIVSSLYILFKTRQIDLLRKLSSIGQLSLYILLLVVVNFNQTNELLQKVFVKYIASLILIGFVISVTVIRDNQQILNKLYMDSKYKKK